MTSGRKAMRQNTRERVISSDWNRQQAFIAGYGNEALREQMLAPMDDSFGVGTTFTAAGPLSTAIDVLVPAAPDYAGVLNGLMVLVPAAGTSILITPGMLLLVDPEGTVGSSDPTPLNPDDGPGPSRLVFSEGVNVVGQLPWTPNPGPGTRVDVVECQRTNVVAETDNRDIFDPSTGLFTPAAVTKVTEGDLTFRIRLGVAGGGVPAPALGWVPLAIMASGAGGVSLDAVAVWDVRPLLSDLASPYAQIRNIFPRIDRYSMVCDRHTVPGELHLSGEAVGIYNGLKIGGIFQEPALAVGTQPFLNITDPAFYLAPAFAAVASLPYYVYALWPAGYQRWVRYWEIPLAAAGGRTPGPCRGILTVSQTPPLHGQPTAPVATPTGWGLGVSTVVGMALASGTVDTALNLLGFVADNEQIHHEPAPAGTWSQEPAVVSGNTLQFALTAGVDYPAGAKRLKLNLQATITGLPINEITNIFSQVFLGDGVNRFAEISRDTRAIVVDGGGTIAAMNTTIDVPTGADGLTVPPAGLLYIWSFPFPPASGIAVVLGWDE